MSLLHGMSSNGLTMSGPLPLANAGEEGQHTPHNMAPQPRTHVIPTTTYANSLNAHRVVGTSFAFSNSVTMSAPFPLNNADITNREIPAALESYLPTEKNRTTVIPTTTYCNPAYRRHVIELNRPYYAYRFTLRSKDIQEAARIMKQRRSEIAFEQELHFN